MHLFRVFTDLRLQRPFEEHSAYSWALLLRTAPFESNMAGYSSVVPYGYTLAWGPSRLCRLG